MPADLQESHAPLAEIAQGPSAFEQFLDRNQKNLVILAILVALGTAAFVVYQGIEKSRQESAGADLCKADDLPSLQAVVNDHAKMKAAQSAMVLLAERQWTEGQQDASIDTLRKFIAENPSHPALATAQASLGSKLMSQGKNDEAAKEFEEVVNDPNARYIAPYALLCLGDIAKLGGDLEKAETSYNRVKTEFPESSFNEPATRRVASLRAKAPVEIEPPPAPKPDAPAPGTNGGAPKIEVTPVPSPAPGAAAPAPAIEVTPVQEKPSADGSEKNADEGEKKGEDAPANPQP